MCLFPVRFIAAFLCAPPVATQFSVVRAPPVATHVSSFWLGATRGLLEAFFAELGQAASQSVSCSESFPTHFAQAFPKPPQDSPSLPEAFPSISEASPSLPEAFPQAELRPGVRACVCVWVCACVRVCVCVCVCASLGGSLWSSLGLSQPASLIT